MAGNNTIQVHISAENEEFVSRMQEIIRSIQEAKRAAGRTSGYTSLSSKLTNLGMITTGVYTGLHMLKAAISGTAGAVMEYNANIEDSQTAFSVFLGNTKLSTQYTNDLKQIAANTPFD